MDLVRTWVADAGFIVEDEAREPWRERSDAYHHVLARAEPADAAGEINRPIRPTTS